MNIFKVEEIYLPVTNLEQSLEWYLCNFPLSLKWRKEHSAGVAFEHGTTLVLVQLHKLNHYVTAPFLFKVYDTRQVYDDLIRKGVEVSEMQEWHQLLSFRFFDLDGNPIAVGGGNETEFENWTFIGIEGNRLTVKNFHQAIEWYCKHLGAEIQYASVTSTRLQNDAKVDLLKNIPISLIESDAPPLVYKQCTFRTTDACADYNELLYKNVTLTELIKNESEIIFSFYDMEGNEFGVIERIV